MEQKSNGTLISAIIIIALLVIGGIYLWRTNAKNKISQPAPAGSSVTTSGAADVSDLESGLNSVDVNSLDQGL